MKKLLILSIFPAPYRTKLFQQFKDFYETDVFFERDNDDNRSSEWFVNDDFVVLNSGKARKFFRSRIHHIREYDLVALYDYTSPRSIFLIILCIIMHIKFVVNCDGVILGIKQNKINSLVKKKLLPHASACLASGEYAKQYFLSYGVKEDAIHIHPFTTLDDNDILDVPIEKEKKRLLRVKYDVSDDSIVFIAIGRYISLKNYTWLLNNWPEGNKYSLFLIGGGEEKEKYEEIIKERNLKNIRVCEYMPKEEILSHLQMADFFIHPTTYDAWGLVVNEALSQGVPCAVSNKCIAGLELVKNGYNGFIFDYEVDCIPTILKKAEELIKSNKNLSKNALESIRGYTYGEMAAAHLRVFDSLLK